MRDDDLIRRGDVWDKFRHIYSNNTCRRMIDEIPSASPAMTRMVSQILWEHCMGDLGTNGNDHENETFAVRSYNWSDEEELNDWHLWHKPSGFRLAWYKYPLRGFAANMSISDAQFLDILRDCQNSLDKEKNVKVHVMHGFDPWWNKESRDEQ